MQELARRTARCRRQHETLLVAFIDLDGFKAINDLHGHDIGDRLLAAIGKSLAGALRSDDFAARPGGDEFVVVGSAASHDSPPAIEAFRERLEQCTRGDFMLGEVVLDYAGPSIGVIAADEDLPDPQTLIARADTAMYVAKRLRRTEATTVGRRKDAP